MIKIINEHVHRYYRCLCENCNIELYFSNEDWLSWNGNYIRCPKCDSCIQEFDCEEIDEKDYNSKKDVREVE